MQHSWLYGSWIQAGRDYVLVSDSEQVCGVLRILDDETFVRVQKRHHKACRSSGDKLLIMKEL